MKKFESNFHLQPMFELIGALVVACLRALLTEQHCLLI